MPRIRPKAVVTGSPWCPSFFTFLAYNSLNRHQAKILASINFYHYFNHLAIFGKRQERKLWEFLALEPYFHILSSLVKLEGNFLLVWSNLYSYQLCFWLPSFRMQLLTLLDTPPSAAGFLLVMSGVKKLRLTTSTFMLLIYRVASRPRFCWIMPHFPVLFKAETVKRSC